MSKYALLKNQIQVAVLAILMALVPVAAAHAVTNPNACPDSNTAKGQVLRGIGQTGNECNDSQVTSVANAAIEILSFIAGIAAVIMLVIAGFKYITSNGDSGKISSAKNTLIYALVGVAVAAVAQVLVNFVINKAGTA